MIAFPHIYWIKTTILKKTFDYLLLFFVSLLPSLHSLMQLLLLLETVQSRRIKTIKGSRLENVDDDARMARYSDDTHSRTVAHLF